MTIQQMNKDNFRPSRRAAEVLGLPVCSLGGCAAADLVIQWAVHGQSRAVLAANVHMVMEARDDLNLGDQLRTADLVVPDGKPLVWALRVFGTTAEHVRGTDLTEEVCRRAETAEIPIGLYGGTPETLAAFQEHLHRSYPSLHVPLLISPPFRPLTQAEDDDLVETVRDSGARILLVSLGCPKQERWMIAHRDRLSCVMLGVGAAFNFLGGTTPEAPGWMQRAGLEWLFRLFSDPRRLWKRYLKHNPRFVALIAAQSLRSAFTRG